MNISSHNNKIKASIKFLLMQFFFCGLILFCSAETAKCSENDYMLVLKDGSTIIGSIKNPELLEKEENSLIKIKTSFGELEIPRDNIIKFFKQPENKNNEKTENPAIETSKTNKIENNKNNEKINVKNEENTKQETQHVKLPEKINSAETETKAKDTLSKTPAAESQSSLENELLGNINEKSPESQVVKNEASNNPDTNKNNEKINGTADAKTEENKVQEAQTVKLPEKVNNTATEIKDTGNKPSAAESQSSLENELLGNINEKSPAESTESHGKPEDKNKAESMLNVDDDKLLDMLGESKIEPPAPAISETSQKSGEIETLKTKYTNKLEGKKALVPENLSDIKEDIKQMASSKTEELLLLNGTSETMVKEGDTKPVEVITVGGGSKIKKEKEAAAKEAVGTNEVAVKGKKGDAKKDKAGNKDGKQKNKKGEKNNSKDSGATGEVKLTTGKVASGTGEVNLTGEVSLKTGEVIIDETLETEYLGGDNLSEKIVKEFKKHKGVSVKDVDSKSHLEDAIEKYIEKPNTKPEKKDGNPDNEKDKNDGKDDKSSKDKK
ncbi:MAG: hypothetical protein QMC67_07455 [Candidatus Wallbacteria bacterium]